MLPLLLTAFLFAAPEPAQTGADTRAKLRVATFNIRYGTAEDGDNRWEKRKGLVLETIKEMDADLLGVQEALAFQVDELKAALPQYECVGVGREDGKQKGEFVPVFFRTKRLEKLAEGHVWLSDMPHAPGSRGWDAQLPRMVTWVRLRDRTAGDGRVLVFANTHFDHKGVRARAESAKLLRTWQAEWAEGKTAVLVGDFNATEEQEPYANLLGKDLTDSFRAAHPKRGPEEGTFHGFTGDRKRERIDWILHTRDVRTVSCDVVHRADGTRYPSDHFPVAAVLEYGPEQK